MYLHRIKDLTTEEELFYYGVYAKVNANWFNHDIDANGVVKKGEACEFGNEERTYDLTVLSRHHSPAVDIAKRYGIKPSYISMIHSPPNSQVGVHTDNKLRQVNLSFPIFYGKQHYRHISYYENKKVIAEYKYAWPCLINAKHPHSAANYDRRTSCMLQISTIQPWDEVVDNFRQRGLIIETGKV